MILERTNNEIVVRLPANIDLTELQNMLDYLEYKENTTDSKATQGDVDDIAEEINRSIWEQVKSQRGIK
jgi:hypothetical protein